jgi:DUF1680 family protein
MLGQCLSSLGSSAAAGPRRRRLPLTLFQVEPVVKHVALRIAASSLSCPLVCLVGAGVVALGCWSGAHAAFGQPLESASPQAAKPLPLSAVRLTGGPLKHAQDITGDYLLSLEPDRMMAGYRIQAGMEPKAEGYGGWDRPNSRQLTGHIAGHYLSAVSLMYASTGDARFKERADYLVREMAEVQNKRGTGYLGAIADNQGNDGEEIFRQVSQGNIRSGGFDLNGLWSPWYTLHKTYAGLRDAYRYAGNKQALQLETKFAEWAESVLRPMSDLQIQQMLNTEFGGMNEIMADLYADTGDKRWLDLSYKFEHRRFTNPLKRHQNRLAGNHGNTAIPKLIGSIDRYAYAGTAEDLLAAAYFWDSVVHHHTFATGGHGQVENFPAADAWGSVVSGGGRTAESCNVYNMLKLTRRLFEFNPDPQYADFQERALFNHVLASIDPQDARTSYMVPVGQGVRQEYANMYESFTCCVGSGMESHALHADGIYYESGNKLWITIYAPSTADWAAQGVKLAMDTSFPEGDSAKVSVEVDTPKELTIAFRQPHWAGAGFQVRVNGELQEQPAPAAERGGRRGRGGRGGEQARGGRGRGQQPVPPVSSFVEIKRAWRSGDTVELTMPKSLRLEPTPDVPNRAAIMYGPLVLAGDLSGMAGGRRGGGRGQGRRGGGGRGGAPANVPVFVAAERPLQEWLQPVEGQTNVFRTAGVGRLPANAQTAPDITFAPFYQTHRKTYGVYWDILSQDEWVTVAGTVTAAEMLRQLEAATVGFVQPGQMQPERDSNYQSSIAERAVEELEGRNGRAGAGWFSFDLPVEADRPLKLLVTYHANAKEGAEFDILVDGTRVGQQPTAGDGFFDVEYAIGAEIVQGKEKVTVRFQAAEGGRIGTVFGVRIVRVNPQQN